MPGPERSIFGWRREAEVSRSCQSRASLFLSVSGKKTTWDAFRPFLVHVSILNLFYWLFALKGLQEGGNEIELRKLAVECLALSGVKVSEGILIKAK